MRTVAWVSGFTAVKALMTATRVPLPSCNVSPIRAWVSRISLGPAAVSRSTLRTVARPSSSEPGTPQALEIGLWNPPATKWTRGPGARTCQRGYTVRFMHSRVAQAEGELERRLRAAARQSLGPDATAAQVDTAVARTQQGPRRLRVGDDTYVRRLVEEETRRLEDAQFERWKS